MRKEAALIFRKRNNRKQKCIAAFFLLLCLTTGGCSFPPELPDGAAGEDEKTYYAYYINKNEDQLIEEKLDMKVDDGDGGNEGLLQKIQNVVTVQPEGHDADEKEALLPDNIRIENLEITDGTLTITLSREYGSMSAGREMLSRLGLVKSFTQIPGVDKVVFMLGNTPFKDSKGNVIGALNQDCFVESAGEDIHTYQSSYAVLYFADESGTRLVPEGRKIYYTSNETLEQVIVEEMILGPQSQGHYAVIAPETKILSVVTQDDICYVNLAGASTGSAVDVLENVRIYAIVNSLAENCKVKQVQFSIDGDTRGNFGGTMPLSQLYEKDFSLVNEQ